MASLMDDFRNVLQEEEKQYRELVTLSYEKKDVIIQAQIDRLNEITEEEQRITTILHNLELKRESVLGDMSVVLHTDRKTLTVDKMIEMLSNQPMERDKLVEVRTALHATLDEMIKINEQNQVLIKQAMEMVDFDLSLFRSMRQAPETANYDRNACNTGELLGRSGFDAKQ